MSRDGGDARASRGKESVTGACVACARRSWLLCALTGVLEYSAADQRRLLALLSLPDGELLNALAGRRASALRERYGELHTIAPASPAGASVCRHGRAFPAALDGPAAPYALMLTAEPGRLRTLTSAPVIAILGTRTPSDYGREMARSFSRALTAGGVTVVAVLAEGIAAAAHAGALETGAGALAVLGGGLDVGCPAALEALYARIKRGGCAISELPPGAHGRRWGMLAAERIAVELAQATVVVEAEETRRALAGAHMAQARGRPVAAVPGRVTSPLSAGSHVLLREGARLVRGPADVLELAHASAATSQLADSQARPAGRRGRGAGLSPALRATLERVGGGCDTPDALARAGDDPWEALGRLSELELLGLLHRGHGGRYVPQEAVSEGARPTRSP